MIPKDIDHIKFERGINPKRALGLGEPVLIRKWASLEKGDILKIKKDFGTNSNNLLIKDSSNGKFYRQYQSGNYLKIDIPPKVYKEDGMVGFSAYIIYYDKLESSDDYFIWGSPWDFEDIFEKVESIWESISFERGKDPKSALGIGLRNGIKGTPPAGSRVLEIVRATRKTGSGHDEIHLEMSTEKMGEIFVDPQKYLERNGDFIIFKEPAGNGWTLSYLLRTGEVYEDHKYNQEKYGFAGPTEFDYIVYEDRYWPIQYYKEPMTESINFKRDQDPKDALGLGSWEILKDKLKKILYLDKERENRFAMVSITEYPAMYICIHWNAFSKSISRLYPRSILRDAGILEYVDTIPLETDNGVSRTFYYRIMKGSPRFREIRLALTRDINGKYIVRDADSLEESVSFERGVEPKRAMGLGPKAKFRDYDSETVAIRLADEVEEASEKIKKEKLLPAVYREGFLDIEDYLDSESRYYDRTGRPSKKAERISVFETELENAIREVIRKYPILDGEENSLVSALYTLNIEGGPWRTYLDKIIAALDPMYLKESASFERGKDPKSVMKVGIGTKFGKMWDLFQTCHTLSENSENFPYVSEIIYEDDHNPYFVIESVFFYTDEDDNKIPEQFVITVYEEYIEVFNAITKDEEYIKSEKKFIELTTCFDPDDNGGWLYENIFRRGKDPKNSLDIGLASKKDLKSGDLFLTYDKINKEYVLMKAIRDSSNQFLSSDEYVSMFVKADPMDSNYKYEGFAPACVWHSGHRRWEFAEQLELDESLKFERGKDPKAAMGIGSPLARLADELGMTYAEISQDKKDLTEIYYAVNDGHIENGLNKDMKFAFYAVADDPLAYDIPRDSRLFDVALWADANPQIAIRILRTPDRVSESLEFNRGQSPLKAIDAGLSRLLNGYSFAERTSGFTAREIAYVCNNLKLPTSEIYQLGFAGEIDYNKWFFNEYTGKLYGFIERGKLIFDQDNKYIQIKIYQTEIGKILLLIADTEGVYFFGGLEPAAKLELWNVSRDEWESIA